MRTENVRSASAVMMKLLDEMARFSAQTEGTAGITTAGTAAAAGSKGAEGAGAASEAAGASAAAEGREPGRGEDAASAGASGAASGQDASGGQPGSKASPKPASITVPASAGPGQGEVGDQGVTRLLYTGAWRDAQHYLAERMRELGLTARFDRVGNLYGRLEGTDPGSKVILTGSHIDTVRSGGRYDGAYGIAAGIAALASLKERFGPPKRSLEVVSLCEEEGSRFPLSYWGSGNVTGVYDWRSAGSYADPDGVTMKEAMEASGFGANTQADPVRNDVEAFVEAHIEQGVILERTGERIGIVSTIVGQRRYTLKLEGEANHAGTTPMTMRQDALAGAAEMMMAAEEEALRHGDPLVATVGRMNVTPNTPNVVPGKVSFTLDVRHSDEAELSDFCERLLGRFDAIAAKRALRLSSELWMDAAPAPMDGGLSGRLQSICAAQGLPHRTMVSGAGHDAQLFSAVCPTAMLFVPSRRGISHSPDEYSSPEALADGLGVLTELLYQLAYEER